MDRARRSASAGATRTLIGVHLACFSAVVNRSKSPSLPVHSEPLLTRLATASSGHPLAGVVEFDLQGLVGGLEGQDCSDPGQIEAVVEEPADLPEADEVVVAVAAGATLAASRSD